MTTLFALSLLRCGQSFPEALTVKAAVSERLPVEVSLRFPKETKRNRKLRFEVRVTNRGVRQVLVDEGLRNFGTIRFELKGWDGKPVYLQRPPPDLCFISELARASESPLRSGEVRARSFRWLDEFGVPLRARSLFVRVRYRSIVYLGEVAFRERTAESGWYRLDFLPNGSVRGRAHPEP